MSDQTEVKGISEAERTANKAIYTGKRIYKVLCELKTEILSSDAEPEALGSFADLDIDILIAEAREIGQVPEWNAESTPVGKKLSYPQGTTGLNQ